jgi:hypothetical protein
VHPAQVCQHPEDFRGFDQCMIVIGQHAPGVNERIAISENPSNVPQNVSIRSRL